MFTEGGSLGEAALLGAEPLLIHPVTSRVDSNKQVPRACFLFIPFPDSSFCYLSLLLEYFKQVEKKKKGINMQPYASTAQLFTL